jgi:hypothetical protein
VAYKYPICDVFHWFCKIARFFATEPVLLYNLCIFAVLAAISPQKPGENGKNTEVLLKSL